MNIQKQQLKGWQRTKHSFNTKNIGLTTLYNQHDNDNTDNYPSTIDKYIPKIHHKHKSQNTKILKNINLAIPKRIQSHQKHLKSSKKHLKDDKDNKINLILDRWQSMIQIRPHRYNLNEQINKHRPKTNIQHIKRAQYQQNNIIKLAKRKYTQNQISICRYINKSKNSISYSQSKRSRCDKLASINCNNNYHNNNQNNNHRYNNQNNDNKEIQYSTKLNSIIYKSRQFDRNPSKLYINYKNYRLITDINHKIYKNNITYSINKNYSLDNRNIINKDNIIKSNKKIMSQGINNCLLNQKQMKNIDLKIVINQYYSKKRNNYNNLQFNQVNKK